MLFSVFILGISSILVNNGVNAGNSRPYWVSVTGFEGAGSTGQDASANGYAGSSLVSPLSASGFNSPLAANNPSSYGAAPSAGFGGFHGSGGNGRSANVAGGRGNLPYRK